MMLLWEYPSCSSVAGLESVIFTSFFSSLYFFLSVGEGKVFEILRVTKGSMLRKKNTLNVVSVLIILSENTIAGMHPLDRSTVVHLWFANRWEAISCISSYLLLSMRCLVLTYYMIRLENTHMGFSVSAKHYLRTSWTFLKILLPCFCAKSYFRGLTLPSSHVLIVNF